MKKKYIPQILIFTIIVMTACKDDFLERYPLSEISPQSFFNTEKDLEIYTNSFYSYLPETEIFTADFSSDNVEQYAINDLVAGRTFVQTDAASAGWTWSQLYNINFFLENYNNAAEQVDKNHYAGIARFFRAYFYFEKVKRFGDVPWYSTSLNENSQDLYKPRDSRTLVMDSIIADLNFAIEHLRDNKNVSRITKWSALALKSRICLYEGTFRKYHTDLNLGGSSDAFLQQSYEASDEIMKSGRYKLYSTGNPNMDYLNLFAAENANTDEYILARIYDRSLNKSTALNQIFTSPTRGNPGLTKSFIDSYLLSDGNSFSSLPNYDQIPFWEEMINRDPRLAQTVRTPGYRRLGTNTPLVPDFAHTPTGYQNIKFVTIPDHDGAGGSTNDLPIFRYAEVLLNFAEAKAELGQLSQEDVDNTINKIRNRVGMPGLTLAGLTADPLLDDQYTYTSNPAILEIRRERRVELVMEGFRYQDLMRWKEGRLLTQTFKGAYFPGKGEFDLDNDGDIDLIIVDNIPDNTIPGVQYYPLAPDKALSEGNSGNLIIHPNVNKVFDESKHYFFPLPLSELLLNNSLTQNPGW